jgi:trans-aconitate methyltransferase
VASIVARQFGRPRGPLGRLIGHGMARANGELSRWVVQQLRALNPPNVDRIIELGPGPGVGLEAALQQFPRSRVWGIDASPEMLSQSRKRNSNAIDSGRLTLIEGSTASLAAIAPVDIIFANHVLYFWHQPADELTRLHGFLVGSGILALGYQLRQNMPSMPQRQFPRAGHILYESDEDVAALLRSTGFTNISHMVKGSPEAPEGRVTFATA